jgi:transcriptional regulator with XRE-family HTH domain
MYEVGRCRLKTLLRERNIQQKDLADKLNMSKQQINDYISGHTSTMSLKTAKNIASALGCHIEELYEWTLSKKKK